MIGAASTIPDEEELARFILTTSWLYKDGRAGTPLRPNAFIPYPGVELSVYRISGLAEADAVTLGNEVAAEREEKHRSKQLKAGKPYPDEKRTFRNLGRGELSARDVRYVKLDVIPDKPPPRHAHIVGWPTLTGNRRVDEAAHTLFALQLAARAQFIST